MTWAIAISLLKYAVTLIIGFVIGFCYFAYVIAKDARPMTIELVQRIVELHKGAGHFSVLVGRRQMIEATKHQIEVHGMLHENDVLAWLDTMDRSFVDEQTSENERVAVEARRQLDEEEAQAKGGST